MQSRGTPSLLVLYFSILAAACSVIALGLTALVQASVGLSQAGTREKTLLDLQIESSREIRRALAAPVVIPPLPPVTAHLARDVREIATASRPKLSPRAMNAMAMDDSRVPQQAELPNPVYDRHAPR